MQVTIDNMRHIGTSWKVDVNLPCLCAPFLGIEDTLSKSDFTNLAEFP